MTVPPPDPPARRLAGATLTLRLLAILLLMFALGAALFVLIARTAVDNARAQQLQDASNHFAARIVALDQGWRAAAYATAQQIELWQGSDAGLPAPEREARLRSVLLTILDQGDFSHAAIVDGAGRVLLRHGTRSQDTPALPATGAADTASGLSWVYSTADRTHYRTVAGACRYGDQPARLVLYVALDNAMLARLAYPSTRLVLRAEGAVVAVSDSGGRASAPAPEQQAGLTLAWDALPGAPALQIERGFTLPLSAGRLLLILAAGAGLALVAGWFVLGRWVRSQSLRLDTLQRATTEFAAAPALSAAIEGRLRDTAAVADDVGLLARNLRAMMQRIEQARVEQARAAEALAQLNAGLEGRVAERTRELELARDDALAAARAKEQFLSNMSHEIRTPMNGMLGALELMSQAPLPAHQSRYVEVAATSGQALLDIINDVLDYAKIGAGGLQIAAEPIDVNAIARSVTTLFSAAAQRKALALRLDADPALDGWHLGDALRLRQVLLNLVGNAIKFTSDGEVVVQTRRVAAAAGDCVAFEVRDTGIGIDASAHGRIFEAFVQADPSSQRRQGGTGLGLAISRDLVQAMGGDLGVTSALGQGAVFHFELPLQRAAQVPAAAPAVDGDALEPLRGRVLLVEDNSVNRLVGSAMLESLGLEVVLAEDGQQALAALSGAPVCLVLMDCQMPVMDGFEATQRLREQERLAARPRSPVVALTGNALRSDAERCLAAGMDAHLAKPFTRAQLHAVVVAWAPQARAGGRQAAASVR